MKHKNMHHPSPCELEYRYRCSIAIPNYGDMPRVRQNRITGNEPLDVLLYNNRNKLNYLNNILREMGYEEP